MTTCGYPQVSWRVNNPAIAEDFDFAWATMDGLSELNELDRWEFDQMTDHRGSLASNASQEYLHFKQPMNGTISDTQWNTCKGINRNLWVSITRVKDSDPQRLSRAARQLQFYPNGTHFADFDITFSNYKGTASLIKVVSMALVAGLAALAF
jgi:hypothetical protein